jgi:hypothetical protein
MLNLTSTAPIVFKTPRELRALLRDCGFNIRSRRGNQEIWEQPLQPGFQAVLLLTDLHTVYRRQRRTKRYAS